MNELVYAFVVARLKQIPGLENIQTTNTKATEKTGALLARATHITSRPSPGEGTLVSDLMRGIVRVDLYTPLNRGTDIAQTIRKQVIAAFPYGSTEVIGDEYVEFGMAYETDGGRVQDQHHNAPVAIEWECFSRRNK
jgi:hypothetical protein